MRSSCRWPEDISTRVPAGRYRPRSSFLPPWRSISDNHNNDNNNNNSNNNSNNNDDDNDNDNDNHSDNMIIINNNHNPRGGIL